MELNSYREKTTAVRVAEAYTGVLPARNQMTHSRKPRSRTDRRRVERDERKLLESKVRLAKLTEGGSEARPINVESASVIERRATTFPCLACDHHTHVVAHDAIHSGEARLRQVTVGCTRCGTRRMLFFKISGPSLN